MAESSHPPGATQGRKKGYRFLGYLSALLSFTIVCAGLIWEVYAFYPEYYYPLSFSLLAVAGVVAYVILTKTIKI
jgi:hypothetical protein